MSLLPRIALSAIAATFRDPIDRAVVSFSARTLARSRQHRLVLAVYIGVALAISLAYIKALLFGEGLSWREPSASLLIPGIVLLFFALLGTRAVFALPVELDANWIFRITNVRRPATYFAAVRRSLFVVGAVPVLVLVAVVYLCIWPAATACEHVLVLLLLSSWLVQSFTRKWRKIPFCCSYLPARTDLRLKFGIAAFLFLFAIDIGANLEQWCLANQRRFWILAGFLAVGAMWSARRTAAVASAPENRLQFEEKAGADIFALDLRPDADYVNASDYIEGVIASPPW